MAKTLKRVWYYNKLDEYDKTPHSVLKCCDTYDTIAQIKRDYCKYNGVVLVAIVNYDKDTITMYSSRYNNYANDLLWTTIRNKY